MTKLPLLPETVLERFPKLRIALEGKTPNMLDNPILRSHKQRLERASKMLGKMPTEVRMSFILRVLDEDDIQTIAEKTFVTVAVARRRVARGFDIVCAYSYRENRKKRRKLFWQRFQRLYFRWRVSHDCK